MLNAMRITRRRVNEQIDDWTSSAGAKANTLAYEDMIDRAYKECDTDQVCSHALDAFRRQLLEEGSVDGKVRDSAPRLLSKNNMVRSFIPDGAMRGSVVTAK